MCEGCTSHKQNTPRDSLVCCSDHMDRKKCQRTGLMSSLRLSDKIVPSKSSVNCLAVSVVEYLTYPGEVKSVLRELVCGIEAKGPPKPQLNFLFAGNNQNYSILALLLSSFSSVALNGLTNGLIILSQWQICWQCNHLKSKSKRFTKRDVKFEKMFILHVFFSIWKPMLTSTDYSLILNAICGILALEFQLHSTHCSLLFWTQIWNKKFLKKSFVARSKIAQIWGH